MIKIFNELNQKRYSCKFLSRDLENKSVDKSVPYLKPRYSFFIRALNSAAKRLRRNPFRTTKKNFTTSD